MDNYSITELRSLLQGLGGVFSGGEKKDLISSVEERVAAVSVKELKAKLAERQIAIPPGSEKKDLVALLASAKAASQQSQTPSAVSFDLSSWTDKEIALLARDRKVDVATLGREQAISKIQTAAKNVKATSLLQGWVGGHDGFRSAASQLDADGKRLLQKTNVTDADIDGLVSSLENIERSLQGHGGMEESVMFPFFKKEFPSFEKYDASLESQHGRAHQLAGEITSHCLVFKKNREPARLQRISQLLTTYSTELHQHLALEEQGVLSLVAAMTSQQTCALSEILGGSKSACGSGGGCGSSSACGGAAKSRNACGAGSCGSKSRNACGGGGCGSSCC